jgi:hypothetical protein
MVRDVNKQNRTMVAGNFHDLHKAFHCVNHNILFSNLQFYGITGVSLQLLKFYLEGRHESMILNNNFPDSCSYWGVLKDGGPTGINIWSIAYFTLH